MAYASSKTLIYVKWLNLVKLHSLSNEFSQYTCSGYPTTKQSKYSNCTVIQQLCNYLLYKIHFHTHCQATIDINIMCGFQMSCQQTQHAWQCDIWVPQI